MLNYQKQFQNAQALEEANKLLEDGKYKEYIAKFGKYTPDGRSEVMDNTPLAMPLGCRKPRTLQEQMALCFRDPYYALRLEQAIASSTDEDDDDFGFDDVEDLEVRTPYYDEEVSSGRDTSDAYIASHEPRNEPVDRQESQGESSSDGVGAKDAQEVNP